MALTERIEHKLEIIPPFSVIQCRQATIIVRDGADFATSYHRTVLSPGDDLSAACREVQSIAAVLWTEEVISAFEDSRQPAALEEGVAAS